MNTETHIQTGESGKGYNLIGLWHGTVAEEAFSDFDCRGLGVHIGTQEQAKAAILIQGLFHMPNMTSALNDLPTGLYDRLLDEELEQLVAVHPELRVVLRRHDNTLQLI